MKLRSELDVRQTAFHVIAMSASTQRANSSGSERDGLQRECDRLRRQVKSQADEIAARNKELKELKARFLRYETALRGSQVTVYTQDRDLRYTSISNPMCGRSEEQIVGSTDDALFPGPAGAAVVELKREALATGEQRRCELSVEDPPATRWYDLHIEPLRDDAGEVVGLTCAAVDVTERKEGEAHLRLLLRELTHRSKNLLAVIQAMARQTARHAGSIDAFLGRFAGRLQALAASHDLLVRESWYGASLHELARSQLSPFVDPTLERVAVNGPKVALKPEAAQSLGLALHELAANAARFGALSTPDGRIALTWDYEIDADGGKTLTLAWREEAGPPVKARRKKGFGSVAIERNLALTLGAKVTLDFSPGGLLCRIVVPAGQLLTPR
jgi:PAS domain S-box-containing protein